MKTIFERDLSGEMVSPNNPGYDELITDISATMKIPRTAAPSTSPPNIFPNWTWRRKSF